MIIFAPAIRRMRAVPSFNDVAVRGSLALAGTAQAAVAQPATSSGTSSMIGLGRLSDAEIGAYVAGGDWRGKAGGYGIQGPAAAFVTRIVGSHPAVMGLPLPETVNLLAGAGWRR